MQGAVAGLVFLAVLVIFAIIVVAKSVALIPQAEAAVIERLGRYSRTVSGQLTLLVPFIDRVRARVDLGALAGGVVLSTFGGDAIGPVLGAGAPAFGHHRCALVAMVVGWVGFRCRDAAAEVAQAGEQQRTARGADIGMPGRGGQNQGAVG